MPGPDKDEDNDEKGGSEGNENALEDTVATGKVVD